MKAAILLKCVSGQLKTYLNLGAQDDMSYATLREQCLKWNRSQQRWSTLVSGSDDMVPMEVDRIDGKGWNNQYGKKGKGKGKNDKEERAREKASPKDGQKGKSKKGTEKGKSKADDRSKGKGKSDKQCFTCGRYGHYSKDCCAFDATRVNISVW